METLLAKNIFTSVHKNIMTSLIQRPQQKISRYLAYKFKYRHNEPYSFYRLYDRETKKIVGMMKAGPEYIDNTCRPFSPNAESYKSFYIYRLQISPEARKQGAGRALINIAKKESVRQFCSGNVHLISQNPINPAETPHLFYRKQGFLCSQYHKSSQDYFDKCIKEGKPVDIKVCGTKIPMYIEKCVVNQGANLDMWHNIARHFPKLFRQI
jgi:GNAT superfamily N-acetyltransferase